MSTGRTVKRELYVGFLLFLLTFLYLSHFTQGTAAETRQPANLKALKLGFTAESDKEVHNG